MVLLEIGATSPVVRALMCYLMMTTSACGMGTWLESVLVAPIFAESVDLIRRSKVQLSNDLLSLKRLHLIRPCLRKQ